MSVYYTNYRKIKFIFLKNFKQTFKLVTTFEKNIYG